MQRDNIRLYYGYRRVKTGELFLQYFCSFKNLCVTIKGFKHIFFYLIRPPL